MGLTAAQKRTLRRALQALVSDVSSKGIRRIAPNRTDDAKVGGDEDEQPLNEMLQAIASDRNRASGHTLGRAQEPWTSWITPPATPVPARSAGRTSRGGV